MDRVTAATLTGDCLVVLRSSRHADGLQVEAVDALPWPGGGEGQAETARRIADRGYTGCPVVLVIPADATFVLIHNVETPPGAPLEDTIRYDVEPELPIPVDDLLLDHASLGGEAGRRALVVAVRKQQVLDAAAALRMVGLNPSAVTAEIAGLIGAYRLSGVLAGESGVLGLHFGVRSVAAVHLSDDGLRSARAIPLRPEAGDQSAPLPPLARASLAAALETGAVSAVVLTGQERDVAAGGLPARRLSFAETPVAGNLHMDGLPAEERCLLAGAAWPLVGAAADLLGCEGSVGLNLWEGRRQGRALVGFVRRPMRMACCLVLALLALWIMRNAASAWHLRARRRAATDEVAAVWDSFHPGGQLPVDPVRALRADLGSLRSAQAPPSLEALSALAWLTSTAGDEGRGVLLNRIAVEGKRIKASGTTGDLAAVNRLAERITAADGTVASSPVTAPAGQGIAFELEIGTGMP